MIITTEMTKIAESSKMSRKCDHRGVVGENDSWKKKHASIKLLFSINNYCSLYYSSEICFRNFHVRHSTHIFKPIFAQLSHDVKETQAGEPCYPEHNLMNMLHIYDAKDEDELVEDKVPELVFDVLQEIHKQNKTSQRVAHPPEILHKIVTCCSEIRRSPNTIFCINLPTKNRQQ